MQHPCPKLLLAVWLCSILATQTVADEPYERPRGLWLTPRQSVQNQARAEVAGRMKHAPREVWRMPTGGAVAFAREVEVGDSTAALILVGNVLELTDWSGKNIWRNARSGVTRVLQVADFDGHAGEEVCVVTDARTVGLLDVATGEELWTWQTPPSTFILGHQFHQTAQGIRFICFPSYALNGYCFDFSGNVRQPRLVWQHDYSGKYEAGYGPAIVLHDMDADGKLDILLSGKHPHVYQAVIDIDTGEIKSEVSFEPEPGSPLPTGRPYGLLQARSLAPGRAPDVVMISCQVEEYVAVARNDDAGQLSRAWGKVIEKDWPEDHLELRPQITSLADLEGRGRVELVLGLWDGGSWSTCVIEPIAGYDARRGTLASRYFWGCYDFDGDGAHEIVVSREMNRRTARATVLEVVSGRTLQPVATLKTAAIFATSDSVLPPDVSFAANRRNPVFLQTAAGDRGILVRQFRAERELGTYFWAPLAAGDRRLRLIAGTRAGRADVAEGRLILSDAAGAVQRYDAELRPVGERLVANGRTCQPLVWSAGGSIELIIDAAGGAILGGAPDLQRNGEFINKHWRISGSFPAAHIDQHGLSRLAVADFEDVDDPAATVYDAPIQPEQKPTRIPLTHPAYLGLTPFGDEFQLLVNLQTGVHTMALAAYDADGRLLWEDKRQGAHPRLPAAADLDGDGQVELVADDHGVLRIYDSMGAILATDKGWPPAYTIPIVGQFGAGGEMRILRASGIQGISLLDDGGQPVWQTPLATWRHYNSLAAVADMNAQGTWCAGILAEDGVFECIDLATGQLRWSLDLETPPNATSVVAGNLDGLGGDEFLLGLQDGRLVCLADSGGTGRILWQKTFEAAVANPIIADLDQDGAAEVVISTADGYLRILRSVE